VSIATFRISLPIVHRRGRITGNITIRCICISVPDDRDERSISGENDVSRSHTTRF